MTSIQKNYDKIIKLGDSQILNLGEIIRYNNRSKIKHENVAEHTFYVSASVLRICKMFNLPDEIKYKALEFATVHDIPELLVGDMPYDTKYNNPELAKLLNDVEVSELEKHMPEFADSYKQYLIEEEEETLCYLVVKLSDAISVLQYSSLELELGNSTLEMKLINEDSIKRVSTLIDSLKLKK